MARTRDANFDLGVEVDFLKDTMWKLSNRVDRLENFIIKKIAKVFPAPNDFSRPTKLSPLVAAPENSKEVPVTEDWNDRPMPLSRKRKTKVFPAPIDFSWPTKPSPLVAAPENSKEVPVNEDWNDRPMPLSRKRKRIKHGDDNCTNSEEKSIQIQWTNSHEKGYLNKKSDQCANDKENGAKRTLTREFKNNKIQNTEQKENNINWTENPRNDVLNKRNNHCAGEKKIKKKSISTSEIENTEYPILKLSKIQFIKKGKAIIVVESGTVDFDDQAETIWTKTDPTGRYRLTGTNGISSPSINSSESLKLQSSSVSTNVLSNSATTSFADDEISEQYGLCSNTFLGAKPSSSVQDEDNSNLCEENYSMSQLDNKRSEGELELSHGPETNNKVRPYQCAICERNFPTKYSLDIHWSRTHRKENSLSCYMCKATFKNNIELKIHRKHHAFPFACDICSRRFRSELLLLEHKKRHPTFPIKCDFCGREFGRTCELKVHEKVHSGEKPSEDCSAPNDFSRRTKRVAAPKTLKDVSFTDDSNDLPDSRKSKRIKHGDNIFANCETIANKMQRTKHDKRGDSNSISIDVPSNSVSQLDSKLPERELRHGPETNIKIRPYQCIMCEKNYPTCRNLRAHWRVAHQKYMPLNCYMCKATFKTKNELQCHKLIHTRPFGCDKCNKRYTSELLLLHHKQTCTEI